jgi:hypothetical protein
MARSQATPTQVKMAFEMMFVLTQETTQVTMAFEMMFEMTQESTQVKMARVGACSRNGRHNAAAMVEDREAPLVRPGQLEEMASMTMWVATVAMALEDCEAPLVHVHELWCTCTCTNFARARVRE